MFDWSQGLIQVTDWIYNLLSIYNTLELINELIKTWKIWGKVTCCAWKTIEIFIFSFSIQALLQIVPSVCVCFPQVFATVQMCLWTRWKPWPLWWPTNVLLLVSIKVLAFHKVYRRSSLNSAHILILYRRLVLMWKCQKIVFFFSCFYLVCLHVYL